MPPNIFSESQMVKILKEAESGRLKAMFANSV